jgi:hypothetical protein
MRRPVQVPCGVEASASLLPTTSVHSTQRVIVGATTEWVEPGGYGDMHVFKCVGAGHA